MDNKQSLKEDRCEQSKKKLFDRLPGSGIQYPLCRDFNRQFVGRTPVKTTEIRVSLAQTMNMGNYENIRPEVSLTAQLEEGDDPVVCARELGETCEKLLAAEAQKLLLVWPDSGRNEQLRFWKTYYSL